MAAMTVSAHSDSPTEFDQLGRKRYVRGLADFLLGAEGPLVVAIYGSWGSGKTSLMLQLRRLIEPQWEEGAPGNAATRTVWFDPWAHQLDNNPVLGLLHATARQLGVQKERAVRDALIAVSAALTDDVRVPGLGITIGRVRSSIAKAAERDFYLREEAARLQDRMESVIRLARAKAERIIFFIDDLDRCQPNVSVAMLEALKLYFGQEGCIFVVSLDRDPIEAAVNAEYGPLGLGAESYLDKIIQVPFVIPRIAEQSIDHFVDQYLPNQLSSCRSLLAACGADNPRQIKRLVNTLILNHTLVDREQFGVSYDPRILAVVLIIQAAAPGIYRKLRREPALFPQLRAGASGGDQSLWEEAQRSDAVAAALRAFTPTANTDITPYITLTAVTSGALDETLPIDLPGILLEHQKWVLSNGAEGKQGSLAGTRLANADLTARILEGADLSGADLSMADLRHAKLSNANLTGARLDGAILNGAQLVGASLKDSSLRGADLRDCSLDGADVDGADLQGAKLLGATTDGIRWSQSGTHWPWDYQPSTDPLDQAPESMDATPEPAGYVSSLTREPAMPDPTPLPYPHDPHVDESGTPMTRKSG
jgi:KAP family P-loop domain/Pentapeptide repeats (8 copies)